MTKKTAILATIGSLATASADVTLPNIFSDHMVLQRGQEVPVWGTADPGESVTVSFGDATTITAAGDDGKWKLSLAPLDASVTGQTFTVKGKNTVTFKDVLVGDVWIGSGQSNMGWTVANALDPDREIASANFPQIRLFQVPRLIATEPKENVPGTWKTCTPGEVENFSAVLYFFGRELHRELSVPIGLINTSWGGTRAEAWTSNEALTSVPELSPILETWTEAYDRYDPEWAQETFKKAKAKWQEKAKAARAAGKEPARAPRPPEGCRDSRHHPSNLYNAMIHPLIPFAVCGATWYQGESNQHLAVQYRKLLPTMIGDWRKRWNQKEFPFLVVQLANFKQATDDPGKDDIWAELQEAQFLTARNTKGVGLAVTNDIGDADDIHPRNKQEVGRRLARWAFHHTYRKSVIVPSGPLFQSVEVLGGELRVRFDFGHGLKSRDGGPLKGFAIAGEDKKWHWAAANVDGDSVLVSSDKVASPVAVRYAWAANPEGANLVNGAGLPASCFRSDNWPRMTRNNKRPHVAYLKPKESP